MRDGKPSGTARLIARSILLASRDPHLRRLVAQNEADITGGILGKAPGGWIFRLALLSIPRSLLLRLESAMLPGIIAHYLVRKRRIERAVREGISSGFRRVAVIGAGYDSLCIRLSAEFPGVDFTEIDHPATQGAKEKAFPGSSNLRYAAADLAGEIQSIFPIGTEPAIFVVEGLTMYLEAGRIADLFRGLGPCCGVLVFTFMEKDTTGAIDFRGQSTWIRRWLSKCGEPFLWGIPRDELPAFLSAAGFDCREIIDDSLLRGEFLVPPGLDEIPLAKGECICIATPTTR